MASHHFSLAEAAQHLPDLLKRAAAGDAIFIDRPGRTPLTLKVQAAVPVDSDLKQL